MYKVIAAKQKDIEILTSIKLVTMIDDELDSKISLQKKKKIKDEIKSSIKKDFSKYKMIIVDGKIAGAYLVLDYEDGLIIDEIYIFKEYQNQGIGTNIINKLKEITINLYVWAYKYNTRFIDFLEKLGFEKQNNNRTLIFKYDSLNLTILNKLKGIQFGYIDKKGSFHSIIDKEFRDNYILHKPEDTLKYKLGLPYDITELTRYIFTELKLDVKTYLILYGNLEDIILHSFIVYKNKDNYLCIEELWLKYKGIHYYKDEKKLLKDVVSKFVKTIPNGNIKNIRLFNYDKPKYNISYDKFINHCLESNQIKI